MRSMRRPELWRTTTFRLALLYGAVFAAGVVALLGLIYVSAAIYLTHQMDEIVIGQAQALERAPPTCRKRCARSKPRMCGASTSTAFSGRTARGSPATSIACPPARRPTA